MDKGFSVSANPNGVSKYTNTINNDFCNNTNHNVKEKGKRKGPGREFRSAARRISNPVRRSDSHCVGFPSKRCLPGFEIRRVVTGVALSFKKLLSSFLFCN